jgi:hypothetical protein
MRDRNIFSDDKIVAVIKLLMEGKGDEGQIEKWDQAELRGLDEVYDLIFYSKEKLTPEQVLKKARELSKPILL